VALAIVAAGCDVPPDGIAAINDAGAGPVLTNDAAPDATVDAGVVDGGAIPADYSIVVLPDTQYYAASFPDIFLKQTSWIVDNRVQQQIAFVLHTGDIVDSDVPEQWDVASRSLHQLDGVVPYVVAAGNHDYNALADRVGMTSVYFPPAGFASYPWFGDTFETGHIENSFSVIPAGSMRWLVISLEFGPRDEALAWAGAVLQAFHDTPAIIITHAYLYHDSTLYDQHGPATQYYNPHSYLMTGQQHTSINDGQEMWQKLILPNRNVKMVFSGHDVNFGDLPPGTTGRLSSTRPDGSVVHQVLANYQTCTAAPCNKSLQGSTVNGGDGYLRIVRFSRATATISISTYSPVLGTWLTDPTNQFTLEMN
jgi:Calcineurin-like phosphoesterase